MINMTLNEFLIKTGVDINNNESFLGNHLDAELSNRGIKIDFNKEINTLNDNELLEIGRILILSENRGNHFFSNQLLDWMKTLISIHNEK